MLAAAIVSAGANVVNKRFLSRVPPVGNVFGQTFVGAAFLLAAAAALESHAPARWTPTALGSLVYLAVFGTAVTFVGLFWLIPRVPVAVIGTIPLVDTLFAVLLGNLVLRERLSARTLLGGILILAGVWFTASRRREPALG